MLHATSGNATNMCSKSCHEIFAHSPRGNTTVHSLALYVQNEKSTGVNCTARTEPLEPFAIVSTRICQLERICLKDNFELPSIYTHTHTHSRKHFQVRIIEIRKVYDKLTRQKLF